MAMFVIMETKTLKIIVVFTTMKILQRIRCVVIAEEDSGGISARSTKNGTRQLRIVMMTRETGS